MLYDLFKVIEVAFEEEANEKVIEELSKFTSEFIGTLDYTPEEVLEYLKELGAGNPMSVLNDWYNMYDEVVEGLKDNE